MLLIQRLLTAAAVAAVLLVSESAVAQTMSAATVILSPGQPFPNRIVGGVNMGASTRPQNQTPLGVSFNDCIQDMTLQFNLLVSGFDGSENFQVWATKSGMCVNPIERGIGGVATCWPVSPSGGFAGQIHQTSTPITVNVRVQDLVGPQNAPSPTFVQQGPSACTVQPSFVPIQLTIAFLPLDSSNTNQVGTPLIFTQAVDLVGPPAPTNVNKSVGDTLFNVNWNINVDSDTAGYDVFIDPTPGQQSAVMGSTDGSVTICDASSTPTPNPQDSGDGSDGDDGSTDAAVSTPSSDAGCFTANVGGMPLGNGGNGACTSTILTSGMVQDSGTVIETDEAGNPIEGGVITGSGGISTIPTTNLVGQGASGMTVSDKNTGNFTITGLTNGVTYNVVVAAVDGFGNVGPPSQEVCDFPAPVNDFWNTYRKDGGGAGGGLCALEAVGKPAPAGVGLGLLLGAAALKRARRIKPRPSAARQPRR